MSLREWLQSEPFDLSLSAGFFGFYAHGGFIAAREENDLYPRALSGSSAGALVASLWASGRHHDDMRDALKMLRKEHFWDPGLGLGLLKGNLFSATLEDLLLAKSFETCRWPLSISVFDLKSLTTHVIDRGTLNPAIRASCAYPGLFHPVKVEDLWAIDGGVLDRSGLAASTPGSRMLYHHLPSRSRWRRRFKRLAGIPKHKNMAVIVPSQLPKLGPKDLAMGMNAYAMSREHTLRMLDADCAETVCLAR